MKIRPFSFLLLCLLAAALHSPVAAEAADETFGIEPWKAAFHGIEMTRGSRDTTAGPEVMVAVRIDLKTDGLGFFGTPDNGDTKLDTDGENGAQFLKRHDLQLAVNTAFFTPCCRYLGSEPLDVTGFAVSQGKKISDWNATRPMVMTINRENEVFFVRNEPKAIGDLWFACAGMDLLKEGKPVTEQNDNRHPRTAAGVTRDGRHLILLVIDGRQPKHSIGTSLYDTARWLIALGAHEGVNFDGGGSSLLVIEGGLTGATILNRPSSGIPRVNAAHLGVFAKSFR